MLTPHCATLVSISRMCDYGDKSYLHLHLLSLKRTPFGAGVQCPSEMRAFGIGPIGREKGIRRAKLCLKQ